MVLLRYYPAPAWREKVKPSKFFPLHFTGQNQLLLFPLKTMNRFYMLLDIAECLKYQTSLPFVNTNSRK